MFDKFPYTNFHELNLDYFINKFNEIFTEWEQLNNTLLEWKAATDTSNALWKTSVENGLTAWKTATEADLNARETALRADLAAWKTATEADIGTWETDTLAALNAWKTTAEATFEAIRVQATASATAAQTAQTAAETAQTAAETAQTAAETAAANVTASAAQIQQNADDIDELKTQFESAINIHSLNIYGGTLVNGYVRPNDGEFISNTTTKVTDFLPVSAGKYVVSAYDDTKIEMYLIAVFDSTKTVIAEPVQKSGDGTQRASGYFFMPANAAYVRVTYLNANVHDGNKLWVLDAVSYDPDIISNKSLVLDDNTLLSFDDIKKAQGNIVQESANIYDGTLTNGYVRPNDGEFVSGTTTKVTDFLEVIPGKYVVSAYNGEKLSMYMIALFDTYQNVIPETVQQSGDGKQRDTGYFLIPKECKYIRVTYLNANAHSENKLWLLDSVSYNPENTELKSIVLDDGSKLPLASLVNKSLLSSTIKAAFGVSHKYYKQKIVAMGDSVTNGQTWFDGAESYFGIRPVNKGVAGSTVSTVGNNGFCTDERVNNIPTDTKLLLVMGGINDWLANVPLGDLSLDNVDTTTFYGAVNVLVQKLNARIPEATIICMGATFGIYPNRTGFTDTEGIYNNLNLCSLDYGKAFADMCHLNGVKSFVIGYECGWNKNNYSTYIDYDGAYLHPNAMGGAKMAEVIADNIP